MKILRVPCGNQINVLNQRLPGLPPELRDVIKDTFIGLLLDMADVYLQQLIGNLDLSEFHASEYWDSFHIFAQNEDIGIGFHGQSWVIEALENGHAGFDIKAALLADPKKVRISKSGERYRNIPMKKDITSHPALKTGMGDDVSIDKIRAVVEKRLKWVFARETPEPKLQESKRYRYQSDYFMLAPPPEDRVGKSSKIERVWTYKGKETESRDEAFVSWVRISDKSTSPWDHPGFIALHAAEHLQSYLLMAADNIKREIESIITEQS